MAIATGAAIALGVGAAISAGVSTVQAVKANKARKEAEDDADDARLLMEDLEANRQQIVNPFENLSNEYANLGVATQAAEFQAEEADIALANTLDTLRATGAGAGGATALAQAALRSKRGVSASLQQQEAQNQKLAAQGAQQVASQKAAGEQWKWQQQETREMQKLNRTQAEIDTSEAQAYQYNADMYTALGNVGSAVSSAGGAWAGAGGGGGVGGGGNTNWMSTSNPNYDAALAQAQAMSNVNWDSDRKLKENIIFKGKSPSGLKIYTFKYINSKYGEGIYQGVMSDEIPKEAVIVGDDGFDRVDYSKLDVEFKKLV